MYNSHTVIGDGRGGVNIKHHVALGAAERNIIDIGRKRKRAVGFTREWCSRVDTNNHERL